MSLLDKDRRDKDIWLFVEEKLKKTVNGETLYRYEAVLELAREKFYLSTLQISRIHKAYDPEQEDPKQLKMELDVPPKEEKKTTGQKAA